MAGETENFGNYKENLPYGPQQVNQPVAGAVQDGSRTIAVAGSDSRRQAKVLLAWGFLLVGIALVMRAYLTSPKTAPASTEVEMAEAAGAEVPTPIAALVEEAPGEDVAATSRKRRRKAK